MKEEDYSIYFENERFFTEPEDSEIHKSKTPEIVNWDKVKLPETTRYLAGDIEVYRALQKSLRDQAPIYELDTDGKQHASTKILFLDSGALLLKESTQKSAEKEGFVYNLSKLCKLNEYFEPTCAAIIDDSYYSISNMFNSSFKSFTNWKKFDENILDGTIKKAAAEGISHKLAVFDYCISNLDRHRSNVFFNGETIKCIDHGRSLIPHGKAFIPAYLRLSDETLVKSGNEDAVRLWLGAVNSDSRLILFKEYINKLDLNFSKSVCQQITDRWEKLAEGRK